MTRTILLAAAATLLIATSGCNKRDETIVNDPMAANDVVDLPGGEEAAPADEPGNAGMAAETNAMGNAGAEAGAGANAAAAGNAAGNGY